jgi:hypothetical protein
MMCNGCGNQSAYHVRTYVNQGQMLDICNACSEIALIDASVPDVYLGKIGQTFKNLADEMGRPYEIKSKRHKKEIMDKLGVSEAGDTVNGAPYGSKSWIEGTRDYRRKQFEKDRPGIRETYRRWKEKGR